MTNPMATALELAPLIERVHGPNHPELTRVRELTFAIDGETGPARVGELFTELREVTGNYTLLDVRASGQAALIPLGAHRCARLCRRACGYSTAQTRNIADAHHCGSSHFRWGWRGESAADEEHA